MAGLRRILIALSVGTALLAAPAHAADLQVANGDFDAGLTGWSGSHSPGGVTATTYEGRTVARFDDLDTTKAYGRESQPGLPATAGARYRAHARVWITSGSADLYLRFRDASGTLLGSAHTPGTQSGEISVSGTAPTGTARVSVLLYSGVANTGTAYWDDVLITKDVTDLGVQIESTVPNATTFAGGTAYALYTGTAATSPQLAVIDLASETVTRTVPIPGATGGWAATTATDGSIYLGTYPASKLYRYTPGGTSVTNLGSAESGHSFIWDLDAGAGGKVYGGTYNDGRYFKYQNGAFTTIGSVPIWSDEEYVRTLDHDEQANATYLGVGGESAALVRFDNVTGDKSNLLPEPYSVNSMVGNVTWTGGKLFAQVNGTLLVLTVTADGDGTYSATTDATITDAALHLSPARDGKVWFLRDGALTSYDLATKAVNSTAVRPEMDVTGYTWLADGTLAGLGAGTGSTKILKYHPATGAWSNNALDGTPILPAAINALGAGPDGKIYTGGYLTGGTGVYNPLKGDADDLKPDTETLHGLHQTDSIQALDGKLYIGVYPSSKLYQYTGTWPPALLYTGGQAGDIEHDCGQNQGPPPQDRPYALAGAPDGTVYMGGVPKYGKRSGGLTIWKAGSGGTTICAVPGQAIVSLAYAAGRVYGGTSTRGALGVTPVYLPGAEATLFSYDGTQIRTHPLPAAITARTAITALTEVDGLLWGMSGGWLFVFDPATGTYPTVKRVLADPDYVNNQGRAFRDAVLLEVDGAVYGTLGDQLFRIDKASKTLTVLHTVAGMDGLTADRYGHLYYKAGERLYRYAL
ncbi:hypothetical protein HNR30_006019 [Nonomuraea soli]|uniref:CBM-cenC domain-containing protein n=1 Tax=Nonomuraea soli TaxID=1032476 RepID=A0A7W0CP46_9ACTN|nr:hypothetical protein [Nonomuraea soli]MBA2894647.1 hypothetical protein [Nonomuraea soli]